MCSLREWIITTRWSLLRQFEIVSKKHGTFTVLVDDEDFERVTAHIWCISKRKSHRTCYVMRREKKFNGKWTTQRLHNFITGQLGIDHKDGDGLNNQKSNLRAATHAQNHQNRRLSMNNKSGYRGVCWNKQQQKYAAYLRVDKRIHLGYFKTAEEANEVVVAARAKLMPFSLDNPDVKA